MEAKDIIFYSNFCTFSKDVINRISKTPLNDNMVYICVDDRNINLPPFVQAVPTIYLTGEKKIIVDDNGYISEINQGVTDNKNPWKLSKN